MKRRSQYVIETANELLQVFSPPSVESSWAAMPSLVDNETAKIIVDTSSHVITLQVSNESNDFVIDESIDIWDLLKVMAETCNIKICLTY